MIEQSVSLASNGVVKVPGYEQMARFGYTKNRGVYRLAVTASGEWEGLTIRAFWHTSGGKDPASSLVVDGYVDVPASVTAQSGNGCITFEGSDGTKTVTSADLRYRVSANSGTEDGTEPEPGTPAWQQLVDAVHTDATAAEQAKTDAQTAAQQAGASAGEAAASAKNAGQSAAEALVWAGAAEKSALAAGSNSQNAAQYAGEATRFAKQAADSSSAAESSASAAAGSQQAAESSAKKSDASANTAQESATLATGSASKAAQAQKNAETAADRAETAQQKTEEVRTDALDKISAAKTDALKAVDAKQADATAAVERTQKKALDAVTAAQGTAVKAVSDAQSTATQAVQMAQTDAVSAVEKAGSEVLESIPKDYQTTVKKVEELKTEKAEIDDSTVGLDAWSSKHIVDMLCPPLEETGNPVQCYPVAGYPLGCKVSWEPTQEGSGAPSPDNVRPIKGRDSVTVERCGENLLDPEENDYGTYTPYGLTIHYIGDNKVHLSGSYQEDGGSFVILDTRQELLAGKGLKITGFTIAGTKQSYTLYGLRTKNETVIAMQAQFVKGDVIDMTVAVVVTDSHVPTTYAPYTGQTATLTLPRTIYGGTVDAVTGDGQETWKLIDSYAGEDLLGKWISDRDVYASGTAPTTGAQVAYKLTEPISFTATGAQPIPALSGVNTVLTDADSAAVTGRADPIKRITDLEDAVASMTTT
jgi:hypothetical protein|nr:MAG TPA: L SHAPED TAIL FIBER PROTEIN [Caudoviricetes sp.]